MNIIEKPILQGVITPDDLPGHEALEERLDIYMGAVFDIDKLEAALDDGELSRTEFLDRTVGAYNIVCGEHTFAMGLIGGYLFGPDDIDTEVQMDERLLMCLWFHDRIDTIIAKMSRVYFENNFTANVVEARIKHHVEQNKG